MHFLNLSGCKHCCMLSCQSDSETVELIYSRNSLLFTGSPQHQESSPDVNIRQGLFPGEGDETLPDEEEEEDEDERASLVALETELQKYLQEG